MRVRRRRRRRRSERRETRRGDCTKRAYPKGLSRERCVRLQNSGSRRPGNRWAQRRCSRAARDAAAPCVSPPTPPPSPSDAGARALYAPESLLYIQYMCVRVNAVEPIKEGHSVSRFRNLDALRNARAKRTESDDCCARSATRRWPDRVLQPSRPAA